MNRITTFSLRAMSIIAVIALAMLATRGTAFAQTGVAFDVKAATGADGRAGEFPFTYTVNYDDKSTQDITVNAEGTAQYTAPANATSPVSIIYLGKSYVIQSNVQFCFPKDPNGGCWCLCLQWVRLWPWWVQPRWFWYYNPCC